MLQRLLIYSMQQWGQIILKSTGNPTGQGDLLFCMFLMAKIISSTVNGESSFLAASVIITGKLRLSRNKFTSVVLGGDSDSYKEE